VVTGQTSVGPLSGAENHRGETPATDTAAPHICRVQPPVSGLKFLFALLLTGKLCTLPSLDYSWTCGYAVACIFNCAPCGYRYQYPPLASSWLTQISWIWRSVLMT